MLDGAGATGNELAGARAALAATDARLAEADRQLADAVCSAHRTAVESIRRIEAVQAQLEAAVARRRTDTSTAAQEFGRFLLDRTREITGIVTDARSEAESKALVLQALTAQYTADSR